MRTTPSDTPEPPRDPQGPDTQERLPLQPREVEDENADPVGERPGRRSAAAEEPETPDADAG